MMCGLQDLPVEREGEAAGSCRALHGWVSRSPTNHPRAGAELSRLHMGRESPRTAERTVAQLISPRGLTPRLPKEPPRGELGKVLGEHLSLHRPEWWLLSRLCY